MKSIISTDIYQTLSI